MTLSALEVAVREMEDNPLLNCGRGSSLIEDGKVEIYSSIMDGKTKANGEAAIVSRIRENAYGIQKEE